jgi:hypothetical protein
VRGRRVSRDRDSRKIRSALNGQHQRRLSAAQGNDLPPLAALSRQCHLAVAAGHGRQDVSAARLSLGGKP